MKHLSNFSKSLSKNNFFPLDFKYFFVLLTTISYLTTNSTFAQTDTASHDEEHKPRSLQALNYVTGWCLNSTGYHPSVYLLLENISGKDLSGITIKLQGKFTDIHTLEPSTAKMEIRQPMKAHQQFPLAVIAPRGYELSRDTNFWPAMECKIMIRVGSVNDEGTEYLLVTRIDQTTQTQDDAFQKLNEISSYNRKVTHTPNTHNNSHLSSHNKQNLNALAATPASISSLNKSSSQTKASLSSQKALAPAQSKNFPGLGDDFYNFEHSFGLPLITDAQKTDFTWAKFKQTQHSHLLTPEIIVASKGRTGKADLIVYTITKNQANDEKVLFEQAKSYMGALKNQKFGIVKRSVRYLPHARVELIDSTAPGVKLLCMSLPDSENRVPAMLVMISRLSQNPDELLFSHAHNNVLKELGLSEK